MSVWTEANQPDKPKDPCARCRRLLIVQSGVICVLIASLVALALIAVSSP